MSLYLGIDPGSRATGFGLIKEESSSLYRVHSGVIRTRGEEPAEKLLQIFEGLEGVLAEYGPAEAAIEKVFVSKNPTGALTLGQARGTAMVALARYGLSVCEYSARQIKQAVVGYGAADKAQVAHMVKVQLNHRAELAQDEADALACAICHVHTRKSMRLVKEQQGSVRETYKKGRIK